MKIIVSSKHLAKVLNTINLEASPITEVSIEAERMILYFSMGARNLSIICPTIQKNHSTIIMQQDRRWDWIKKLSNQIDEQPLTLDIMERFVDLIISC